MYVCPEYVHTYQLAQCPPDISVHITLHVLPSVGGLILRVMGSEEAMIFTTMRNEKHGRHGSDFDTPYIRSITEGLVVSNES